jgi:DNA-directed RNA polymerase specialized sigma24 family protein
VRKRREAQERRRAREFESFVAGAAGRLLHAAQLLTAEPPRDAPVAEQLLTAALGRTYARWDRLRGEDPYEAARQELIARFAHTAWRHRRPVGEEAGVLARLTPQERMVLVLRLFEGVAEEQTAAALGLASERVNTIVLRASAAVLAPPPGDGPPNPGATPRTGPRPGRAPKAPRVAQP